FRWMTPLSPSPGPPMTRRVVPGKAGLGIGLIAPDQRALKLTCRAPALVPPASVSLLDASGNCRSGVSADRAAPVERKRLRIAERVAAVTWRMRVVPPVCFRYRKTGNLANPGGLCRLGEGLYGLLNAPADDPGPPSGGFSARSGQANEERPRPFEDAGISVDTERNRQEVGRPRFAETLQRL